MPHNTAAAASATGTPAPIEGAGAPSGMACAAVAVPMRHPLAIIANNLIYRSSWVINPAATKHNVSVSSSGFLSVNVNSPISIRRMTGVAGLERNSVPYRGCASAQT
jgi:hypothetical protein